MPFCILSRRAGTRGDQSQRSNGGHPVYVEGQGMVSLEKAICAWILRKRNLTLIRILESNHVWRLNIYAGRPTRLNLPPTTTWQNSFLLRYYFCSLYLEKISLVGLPTIPHLCEESKAKKYIIFRGVEAEGITL